MSWANKFSKPYRIEHGKNFRLKDFDPASTAHFGSPEAGKRLLTKSVEEMAELQDKLYAQDRWSVLLIFQAMDAAGKDGAIKHVMSGVNPQGCQVYSFKTPSSEDLNHDFLWRTSKVLPERGHIGIFNRSYYEEVLVVRVHRDILNHERLTESLISKNLWQERFDDIGNFERYLSHSGTVSRKFFLNVPNKEQKRRFLERLDTPEKNWKFSASDIAERAFWDSYMEAYQEASSATSTEWAPWYVVPADNKWGSRAIVAD